MYVSTYPLDIEDHVVLIWVISPSGQSIPKDDMFFFPNVQRSNVSNQKRAPGCLGDLLGWKTAQLYGGYNVSH